MNKTLLILALFGLALLPSLARAEQLAQHLAFKTSFLDSSRYIFKAPLIYLLTFFLGLLIYSLKDYLIKKLNSLYEKGK